jgi:RNA polymerase sigma-70 factor (ECF subfamily)
LEQHRHIKAEDATLVERWRQGDISAIERLVGKYQGRIYNLILKICANPDTAAELTQDTFVKIIENIDRFESRSSFYTWAFRIAVNLTLNYCKRKTAVRWSSLDAETSGHQGIRSSGYQDEPVEATLAGILKDEKTPDPAQIAENRELCRLVQVALGKLDEEQRTVVVLRDIEGMDYAQIAEVLAVELGTVKSRLSRARAALRQILEAL